MTMPEQKLCKRGNIAIRDSSGHCHCKDCITHNSTVSKAYRQRKPRDKEQQAAYWKEYYNRPGMREKWYAHNRTKKQTAEGIADTRERNVRRKYGIGHSDYEKMYEDQNGKCFICKTPKEKLAIDHNHANNKVRHLLCTRCNTLVGYIERKPEIIGDIQSYIHNNNIL